MRMEDNNTDYEANPNWSRPFPHFCWMTAGTGGRSGRPSTRSGFLEGPGPLWDRAED